jgi:hypothetical protein
MTKKKVFLLIILLFFAVMVGTVNAKVSDTAGQCIKDAKDEYKVCKDVCLEYFQADKDICRNVDHVCAGECRAGYETCTMIPMDIMDACKALCHSALDDAKQQCIVAYPEGSTDRDSCIDQAQVVAFMCRDECREGIQGNMKECRAILRNCLKACRVPASE